MTTNTTHIEEPVFDRDVLQEFMRRDEAIDAAVKELSDSYVEYGINYVEPKENLD